MPTPEQQPAQVQIEIDDATAQGVYANMALISHTETEFVIDFIYVQSQAPKGKVRTRIVSSPSHTKRLLAALAENVKRYEEKFGALRAAGVEERDTTRNRGNYL